MINRLMYNNDYDSSLPNMLSQRMRENVFNDLGISIIYSPNDPSIPDITLIRPEKSRSRYSRKLWPAEIG